MKSMDSDPAIGTVILAAGESSRLGQAKQLVSFRGASLLRRATEHALALAAGPVAVVLGARTEEIRPALDGLDLLVVENPAWRQGMGTSLSTGLQELLRTSPDVHGVLIMLCDQPLVTESALRALCDAYRAGGNRITASGYAGAVGVPAIFARSLFPELLALEGGMGARTIIQRHRDSVRVVPIPEAALDVDTAEDLAELTKRETS